MPERGGHEWSVLDPAAILESLVTAGGTLPPTWTPYVPPTAAVTNVPAALLAAFDDLVSAAAEGWESAIAADPTLPGRLGTSAEAMICGLPLGIHYGYLLSLWSLYQAGEEPDLRALRALSDRRIRLFIGGETSLDAISQMGKEPTAGAQIPNMWRIIEPYSSGFVGAAHRFVVQVLDHSGVSPTTSGVLHRLARLTGSQPPDDLASPPSASASRLPPWAHQADMARAWDHRGPLAVALSEAHTRWRSSMSESAREAFRPVIRSLDGAIMSALAQAPGSPSSWALLHDAAPALGLDATACWSERTLRAFGLDVHLVSVLTVAVAIGQEHGPAQACAVLDCYARAGSVIVALTDDAAVAIPAQQLASSVPSVCELFLK